MMTPQGFSVAVLMGITARVVGAPKKTKGSQGSTLGRADVSPASRLVPGSVAVRTREDCVTHALRSSPAPPAPVSVKADPRAQTKQDYMIGLLGIVVVTTILGLSVDLILKYLL
jgi:hypothetical protein